MKSNRIIIGLLVAVVLTLTSLIARQGFAQTSPLETVTQTSYAKLYIPPMENSFDTFLTAALMKNKVPVTIVLEEGSADYVMAGAAVKGTNRWSDTIFGAERDRTQGSIKLVKVADKSIVWAGTAGDKTVFFTLFRKGGQQKVAERLAKMLKKEYFNKK